MAGPEVTTRAAKGAPLTFDEIDANFTSIRQAAIDNALSWEGGDVTVSEAGVASIGDGVIVNADFSGSAQISFSKLAAMPEGSILLGGPGNTPTAMVVTGDVTIAAGGSATLAAGAINNSHIAADAAIAISKLAPMAAGSVVIGAADGTPTATAISGDITLAADGATSLAAGVIDDSHIAAGAAIDSSKLAPISASGKVANSATTATSANTAEAIVARSAAGNIDITSVNDGYLAGCRNILINGDLRINQRGATIAAAGVGSYGPDRWKKTGASTMTQIIEDGNYIPGATYTLSGTGVTEQQLTAPGSGNWTLPNISTTATDIQLELGTVATPFEKRPLALEHLLCRRYFMRISSIDLGCSNLAGRFAEGAGNRFICGHFAFPVPMTTTPTVTNTAPTYIQCSALQWHAAPDGITATVAGNGYVIFVVYNFTADLDAEL